MEMKKRAHVEYASYEGYFTLDELRQMVKDTESWDGGTHVTPEVHEGERPYGGGYVSIEIGSYL